jgi:hypothetical protein
MNFQHVKDRNQAALARLERCLVSTAPTLTGGRQPQSLPRPSSHKQDRRSNSNSNQEAGAQVKDKLEDGNDNEEDDKCTDEAFKVVVGTYAYFTFAFIDQGESGETVWLRSQVSVAFVEIVNWLWASKS